MNEEIARRKKVEEEARALKAEVERLKKQSKSAESSHPQTIKHRLCNSFILKVELIHVMRCFLQQCKKHDVVTANDADGENQNLRQIRQVAFERVVSHSIALNGVRWLTSFAGGIMSALMQYAVETTSAVRRNITNPPGCIWACCVTFVR